MDLLGLVKKLWKAWNLKGVILLSLSLQTFLILFGSLRKRTANTVAIMFIWIAYLLADWAASFAVGLISKAQGAAPPGEGDNADLLAFWAPFLLVHLGGPDTITAFSLEDNELWLRHFLGLAFQVAAAVYIFSQAFPENKLLFPTILLFISGTIKFVERTRALYLASAKSFRESMLTEPDPGPNYAKLMDEYSSKLEANLPTKIIMIAERNNRIASQKVEAFGASDDYELDNIEIVKQAYRQFKTFKGLIVDLIFSFRERDNSRAFFHNTKAEEALSLIEVELNFFYDVLYTKIVVVRQKVGYICRFVCFACVAIALFLFYGMDKKGFHTSNIDITFTLLIGALSLDLIALLQMIFSDWTVANLSEESSILTSIFMKYLSLKRSTWSTNRESNNSWMSTRCLRWITNRFFRRWCGSIPKYNLIEYCIQEHPKEVHEFHDYPRILFNKVIGYLGMKDLLDHIRYVSRKTFTEKLWNFIFEELKKKSLVAADPDVAKGIFSARGEWVLRDIECRELMRYIADVEYDESLLLWHIATELCYNLDTRRSGSNSDDSCREFSKTLSDYMLYLLVVQSAMMVPGHMCRGREILCEQGVVAISRYGTTRTAGIKVYPCREHFCEASGCEGRQEQVRAVRGKQIGQGAQQDGREEEVGDREQSVGRVAIVRSQPLQGCSSCPAAQQRRGARHICVAVDGTFWARGAVPDQRRPCPGQAHCAQIITKFIKLMHKVYR
ncbi:uncharacterized protein LOC116203925 isoform X1 [Punica granatum]|uniref:Uncharacterized protein LOC116203925 isoform X1 n=1 Tax=Punica granatum TaxID=22663 RepID=A0A6P8DB43_PUNGR|nr:uncharacterized protein LOC116203925 isoform X1 [Punica granatum]